MLEEERKRMSFDVEELARFIYGGNEGVERFLEIQKKVSNDPILRFHPEHIQVSRKELFEIMAKKLVRYHEMFQYSQEMKGYEELFFNQTMPLAVHFLMFYSVLKNLCTEEQKVLFLEPTYNGEILGCYAQTELGHGSDVQNLQTTATYDIDTKTFIMNSPSYSSIKWWIGELGTLANHACVMAQLIIKGKRYGPHAFIVNIRDMKSHLPLQGVEVGDIGPKYGYNAKDNGFLKLTNVRIPRVNMLSKYSSVSTDGVYSKTGDQKVSYATMLTVRAKIPTTCFWGLSIATTIITRYSLIRKQFKDANEKEIQILDYQLQQDKVIPYIAQTYALLFGSRRLIALGKQVIEEVQQKGDFSRLNSTHALSSGLKAIFTSDTMKALEIMRRAAGGHGFSSYSGISLVSNEIAPTVTYEGENTILLLQTARFINKSIESIKANKPVVDISQHLFQASKLSSLEIPITKKEDFLNPSIIRRIFLNNSYFRSTAAIEKLKKGVQSGLSPKQSWDHHAGLLLAEASTAFIYYWIYNNFLESVERISNEPVKKVLTKLLCLYGVHKILQYSNSYFEGEILYSQGLKHSFNAKQHLLNDLRRDSLGLMEAFHYDDNTLKSAIGRRDGKAYQTLLNWAKYQNRANHASQKKQFLSLINQNKGNISLAKL